MKSPGKKKRKKIRFKAVQVKLSEKQHTTALRYCRLMHLTPNKLLRLALREFMDRNAHRLPEPGAKVGKNQLSLFESQPKKVIQLSILDSLGNDPQVAEE